MEQVALAGKFSSQNLLWFQLYIHRDRAITRNLVERAEAAGFRTLCVTVSNHGGRQLNGAIATIDALADVVAAVEDKIEVLLDGGIRRGTDILKALSLGAKAVLIGRPILWGLAVEGKTGVKHVLEILHDELDMALSGCAR